VEVGAGAGLGPQAARPCSEERDRRHITRCHHLQAL
jgi:hypothetical protein